MIAAAPAEADDLNHLRLSCWLSSELASGLRYAYARLDTIDRKASEIFRSFTWVFGLLGGLTALGSRAFVWERSGAPSPIQLLVLIGFVVLLLVAIAITAIHKEISSLTYYRIGRDTLDAAAFGPATPKLTSLDPGLQPYLATISAVTVRREGRLAIMARLHSFGLVAAGCLLLCLIGAALPAPR